MLDLMELLLFRGDISLGMQISVLGLIRHM